ncbi:RsmE family RNA methyltransferase [Gimesia aquarii]|uniref:Ribosomal RNA small subunit methyltransferase E n=1 Tax=Gimesia aquarii TaxID=2527964 RepID=A0A517WTQ1_9PLAN|nr:RsmE family RNA methyltransferase [Gimesia aquarii]QDU08635.1 Ribosomal RNA small subunit methyltransferase E [Gimesia aquarii]
MPHRFYFEGSLDPDQLLLEGGEAHHGLHVLRLQIGDSVLVFNGTGAEAEGVITKTSRKIIEIKVSGRRETPVETQVPLILATAVPKGDRFRWLVEKAAELGVSKLVPLITERSSVDPGENRLKKLQQTIVAAAKQSGQTRMMELAAVQKWDDFLEETSRSECQMFVADPQGTGLDVLNTISTNASSGALVLLIGPEGGFSPEELDSALEQGAKPIKLSKGILRIETAAILFAGLIRLASDQRD